MEITSIKKIIELKNEILEEISSLDIDSYDDQFFGAEDEFTYKEIIEILNSLLTDITSITSSPKQFINISTADERNIIEEILGDVFSCLEDPDDLIKHIDSLKVTLRPFKIIDTKDLLLELETGVSELNHKKLTLEQELKDVFILKNSIEKELKEYSNKKNEIVNLVSNIELEYNKLRKGNSNLSSQIEIANKSVDSTKNLIEKSKNATKEIEDLLKQAQESYANFVNLSRELGANFQTMDVIEKRYNDFELLMSQNNKDITALKEKARQTIDNALVALGYRTAQGLSASFQTQITKIEKSLFWLWLVGSGIFLLSTVGVGIWILNTETATMISIIGRLAITPFTIAGAIFCANQYIRTKNLLDDYSYKLVIAQSIVGFSEQLKDSTTSSDEYKDYIRLALEQIHQDPLRKRPKVSKDVDGGIKNGIDYVLETAQKVVNLTKPGDK